MCAINLILVPIVLGSPKTLTVKHDVAVCYAVRNYNKYFETAFVAVAPRTLVHFSFGSHNEMHGAMRV